MSRNLFDALCSHADTDLRRKTREVLMAELDIELHPNDIPTGAYEVGSAGGRTTIALEVALQEWMSNISEPSRNGKKKNSAARIDDYIRGPQGLSWGSVEVGNDARPNISYEANGDFSWCGAFVAFCYGQAGLKSEIRKRVMPSTFRLRKWGIKSNRIITDVAEVRFGDIVIVGHKKSKPWGNHITLCRGIEIVSGVVEYILTFEGNAKGPGPKKRHEGVIKHKRPVSWTAKNDKDYRFKFAIRFDEVDFK